MSIADRAVGLVASKVCKPPTRQRDRPLEVLCLGFPRTGTESMCKALQMLGYDGVYHGFSLLERPGDWPLWNKAAMAKFRGIGTFDRHDWDSLLGQHAAITDMPGVCFSFELLEAYPDAKVILTTRKADDWVRSATKLNMSIWSLYALYLLSHFDPLALVATHTFLFLLGWQMVPAWSTAALRARYLEHDATIRGLVPKERLLEYHVSEGWAPLCQFLDKPVPSQDVPKGNSTQEFLAMRGYRIWLLYAKAVRNLLLLSLVSLAAVIFMRR